MELGHLNLSDHLKKFIVGKLAQGVEIPKILDDIRDKMTDVTRDTFVTSKDLQNIKKQYNISGTQKHHEDGISVDLWVQESITEPDNPVIFYKPQGTPHDHLKDEDFLLCLQTAFQRNMIKYASKTICIDSTHNTTQYDFMLTTVLVLDEFEEAVPVASAVSNREDAEILEVFFQSSVKRCCGQNFTTDIFINFMSDLANNFYNARCATFPQPIRRFYCSWHVDKRWRKYIKDLIHFDEQQCNTYTYLKLLQTDPDEANFRKTLQQFLSFLEQTSPPFLNYFSQNFVAENNFFFMGSMF